MTTPELLPGDAPLVSVVIPVKNGGATIEACLKGVLSQSLPSPIEVIVIDSGSTDGTPELVAKFPVRFHKIVPEEFNHGATRNFGVKIARGEFVVMTVQDAVPINNQWLANLLRHFADAKVAGVCGQQIVPHDVNTNPMAWFRPVSAPMSRRFCFASKKEFDQLSPRSQLEYCGWDDVCAAYRRSVLLDLPFQCVSFGEDLIWARDAFGAGHALVFEPQAQVFHYHSESFRFRFRRTFTTQYFRQRYFGCRAPAKSLLRAWAAAAYHLARWKEVSWNSKFCWLGYNFSRDLAEWLANHMLSVMCLVCPQSMLDRIQRRHCGTPFEPAKRAGWLR